MTWLRRLLGRDDPPTLVAQYRQLWRVPADWQHRTTARVVTKRKELAVVKSSQERKGAA